MAPGVCSNIKDLTAKQTALYVNKSSKVLSLQTRSRRRSVHKKLELFESFSDAFSMSKYSIFPFHFLQL